MSESDIWYHLKSSGKSLSEVTKPSVFYLPPIINEIGDQYRNATAISKLQDQRCQV